ncbi:trihelix transcription factor ASIL2 [Artemisia annua]|uniref:Trihelix transcription factor ASIL2 n=1 Tax=Artemisia annua TaxID=35608 RepID=A0A2U1MNG7_ARTAN|nr:trihelix transcription factor ASIL2 [Artemisia annua]
MSSSSSGGNTKHQSLKKTTKREDHWSDSDTFTLIESWGKLFLQLDHSGLSQHHWQQVAEKVNKCHVSTIQRSHNQCRNRLDTLKKKYKVEKNRVCNEPGYVSTWRFFNRLDFFIGPVFKWCGTTARGIGPAREVELRRFLEVEAARGVFTPTMELTRAPAVITARGVAPVIKPYSAPVVFKRFSDTPVPARELKRKMFSVDEAARGVFTPPQEVTRDSVVLTERKWMPAVTTARGVDPPLQEWKGAPGVIPAVMTARELVMNARAVLPARELKRKRFTEVEAARGVFTPPQEWKGTPAVTTASRVLPPPRSAVPVHRQAVLKDSSFFRGNVGLCGAKDDLDLDMDKEMLQECGGNADVKLKGNVNGRRRVEKERDECGQLVEALGRFVEVYEKVEVAKGRQLVELEKQRMRFTMDLEIQRMRLLMESQVQFEKLKWLMKSESDIFQKR